MLSSFFQTIRFSQKEEDSQKGQDLAEYGLLMGFLAIFTMAGVAFLGDQITAVLQAIVNYLSTNPIP
jgi:Flp pilus assembly pilin Flp